MDKIVILASGQSNMQSHPPLDWTPPPNLLIWDWDDHDDTHVGTGFFAAPSTMMSFCLSRAECLALENPNKDVCVIVIAKGSRDISHWISDAVSPRMGHAIEANVPTALASIGRTTIDEFDWWQCENDAIVLNSQTYPADFEALVSRLRGNNWFPHDTPIAVMSLSEKYCLGPHLIYGNNWLRECVAADPENRVFVDTTGLDASHWIGPDYLHMTAAGYRVAGKLCHQTMARPRPRVWQPKSEIYKRSTDCRVNTSDFAEDPELRAWLWSGKTYRVIFHISGKVPGGVGIKYGWSHGTSNLVVTGITIRVAGVSSVRNYVVEGLVPEGTIEVTEDRYFMLDAELFVNAASVDGWLDFIWAQYLPSAAKAYVFANSYVEVIQMR